MVIQCDTVAHLSLEDPFHAEEGSSDPLGGQQGRWRPPFKFKIMFYPERTRQIHQNVTVLVLYVFPKNFFFSIKINLQSFLRQMG